MKKWERPSYLDTWGEPVFKNEEYLFRESMLKKHWDACTWAGAQIGHLMQAAIDEFAEMGVPRAEAAEKLKKRLRDARREEAYKIIEENNIKPEDRNARTIGHLIMRWEAALGVSGEIMINTPERFLRRFYGGAPWDQELTALVLDVMGAEGEGMAEGITKDCPVQLTFRTNRYSCGGDTFDEWVVEPIDEISVGRDERIPDGSDKD